MRTSRPLQRSHVCAVLLLVCAVLTHASWSADLLSVDGHDFNIDTSPTDGAIALDFMESIWTLPTTGGLAQRLTDGLTPVSHPRWSPDGKFIVYQARTQSGAQVWQAEIATGQKRRIIQAPFHIQDVSWHPDGQRLVYATAQHGNGLDIYETDLPTGLSWRVTSHRGDESEPAWSANGQHLAYIRTTRGRESGGESGDRHALILRRKGEPEIELVVSATPLAGPSWRPDGSMLTFFRQDGNGWTLQMAILSTPALVRTISDSEEFFPSPVRWRDRMHMLYAADGRIKTRGFEDRRARPVFFRAAIDNPAPIAPRVAANRQLEIIDAPNGRLVIRAQRLFDGIWSGYREQMDVLVEGGLIAAIEPRRDWPGDTVLDLGASTIMPGLIDSWAALPDTIRESDGAAVLAYGVTTLVSPDLQPNSIPDPSPGAGSPSFDPATWESEEHPGPRLLIAGDLAGSAIEDLQSNAYLVRIRPDAESATDSSASVAELHRRGIPVIVDSWNIGRRTGANVFLGVDWLTARGDRANATANESFTFISGLADAGTPGMDALLRARQSTAFGNVRRPDRRITTIPQLATTASFVVAGSRPNGLPPGLALHAELHALSSAGLDGEDVLLAAGRNAAVLLGLENRVGTITPGAAADLLLVNGDPLSQSGDTLNIAAVVRNGRLYSLVRLLELATGGNSVE